jgi:hypothetical protein
MAKYLHECNGERFEIDVDGLRLVAGQPATCFIARISTLNGKQPVWMVEKGLCRREIYGQTETWALKNARDFLEREDWIVEDEPVRRGHHQPELMSV